MEQILVIDDDDDLRTTIIEVLEQEGLTAHPAENADLALNLLKKHPYHLVLLDMVMPGTDGMTAIPLIRQQAPRTRIIAMTAFSSAENAVQAMQRGADDYLVKPFKIDALMLSIRQNLQEARFQECHKDTDMDDVFQGLSNVLRRQILIFLHRQGMTRFMDLVRALEVEDHTKVNFHLKVLREVGFIEQNAHKQYSLTNSGERAAECLSFISKNI
ncbi:MAG: response regulator [Desulfobulbaceae bacterium]|uniref:Response regulator n=1 Tax=Candidatus Desulfatifera sulfidica TaxID=2841691 RepID=A0A8J6NAJ1_9BACT|nr:response regulator [Candidatus Desulfatifera sulfidica]